MARVEDNGRLLQVSLLLVPPASHIPARRYSIKRDDRARGTIASAGE